MPPLRKYSISSSVSIRHTSGTCFTEPSGDVISAVIRWRGLRSPARPRIVTVSSPLRPSHGPDAQQDRALGGPVAGGAGAVFLAGQHDQRHALLFVAHGGVVDEHALAV